MENIVYKDSGDTEGVDSDKQDLGVRLLAYHMETEELKVLCENSETLQEIEALDALSDDTLLFGFHDKYGPQDDPLLKLGVFNTETCEVEASRLVDTMDYLDIEGIAWRECL